MGNAEKEVVAERRSARSGVQSFPGERPVRVPTVVFLRGTFRCQYAQCGLLLLPWTRPPKWPSQGSIFKIVASVCISCLPAFMFEQLMSYEAHFMRHVGNIRWTVRAIMGHHSQYRCGGGIAERARAFPIFSAAADYPPCPPFSLYDERENVPQQFLAKELFNEQKRRRTARPPY